MDRTTKARLAQQARFIIEEGSHLMDAIAMDDIQRALEFATAIEQVDIQVLIRRLREAGAV